MDQGLLECKGVLTNFFSSIPFSDKEEFIATMLVVFFVSLTVALVVSASCSIAESVLLSLSTAQIMDIRSKNARVGDIWKKFKGNINEPITAILALNTSAHTIGASFAGAAFAELTHSRWIGWFSLAFTFLMLQFTEILPKTYGVRYNKRFAYIIAYPLFVVTKACRPVVRFLDFLNAPFKSRDPEASKPFEISSEIRLLTLYADQSQVDDEQKKIILAALKLSKTSIATVMVPIDRVVAFRDGMTLREILAASRTHLHTRYPVCDASEPRRLLGYVKIKELINSDQWKTVQTESSYADHSSYVWEESYELLKASPHDKASEVLKRLVDNQRHMVEIQDENGLALGIATLEDLVEELVGEIGEEFHAPNGDRVDKADVLLFDGSSAISQVALSVSRKFAIESELFVNLVANMDSTASLAEWFESSPGVCEVESSFVIGDLIFARTLGEPEYSVYAKSSIKS